MRITERLEYPAAPHAVFTMLTDPAFQRQKLAESGAVGGTEAQVSRDSAADTATIRTRREMPTENLPDYAKRIVGGALSIREVYEFGAADATGARRGTVEVTVDGAPIGLKGTAALDATPSGGSALTIDGDLKARIPLVGGKIESAAAPWVVNGMRAEERTARTWLTAPPQ